MATSKASLFGSDVQYDVATDSFRTPYGSLSHMMDVRQMQAQRNMMEEAYRAQQMAAMSQQSIGLTQRLLDTELTRGDHLTALSPKSSPVLLLL